jgi:hypothetical protein
MRLIELKRIVEENSCTLRQEDNNLAILIGRHRFPFLYFDAEYGVRVSTGHYISSSEEITVLRALLDYSETPIEEREDKTHTFTEFEKQLLQEGYRDFPYITRKSDGTIVLHQHKPSKTTHQKTKIGYWSSQPKTTYLSKLNHLFKSVQWEDEEPCEWEKWV